MREIASGIFIETAYEGVNVAAILTDEGVLCIDIPSYPRDARDWVSRLSRLHGRGVRYLILTDYHGDRILNTRWLSAPIVASQPTADRLATYDRRYPQPLLDNLAQRNPHLGRELTSGPVDQVAISFAGQMTLNCGRHLIHLRHKPGPNAGSLWVECPEASIVFTGDSVVTTSQPPLSELILDHWLASLEGLQAGKPEASLVVPGRGEPTGSEGVSSMIAYLQGISTFVEEHVSAGGSRQELSGHAAELVDQLPSPGFASDWALREITLGLQRAYDQLAVAAGANGGHLVEQ